MTLLQALSPAAGLAVNCAAQVLACRLGCGLLRSIYLGFAAGGAACALISGHGADLLAALVTYAALGYCYFHFLNLGETARRVRLVRELAEAGPAGLTRRELLARYNAVMMVRARLDRLIKNSQVSERDGRYYAGKPGILYAAKALSAMKALLLGRGREGL